MTEPATYIEPPSPPPAMQAEEPTLNITIKGTPYALDISRVTGIESRDFREAVGVPLIEAASRAGDGKLDTLEFVAAVKWLIDRRTDPTLQYLTVLGSLTYADLTPIKKSGSDG